MIVCALNEVSNDEKRVAITPDTAAVLAKEGMSVVIERGAGEAAGFSDREYEERGAKVLDSKAEVLAECEVLLALNRPDPHLLRSGQALIGTVNPFERIEELMRFRDAGVTVYALELLPRIARAQSMDILTSMAYISGYRAVILAAYYSPMVLQRIVSAAAVFPPIKVLVIGAGVAGLTAIALARKFGTDVYGYDIRPEAMEEIKSVGGKPLELKIEVGEGVSDKYGYAKYLGEEFYKKQRQALAEALRDFDIVITSAFALGKKAPLLITEEAVKGMKPGSVIVDLAAERGGNCELTVPGKVVRRHGVTIVGLTNLPSTVPYHSSLLAARNLANFLLYVIKKGWDEPDLNDEIIRDTLLFRKGEIVSPRFKEIVERLGGGA